MLGPPDRGDLPRITVVIATRNRETRLAFALEALAAQEVSPKRLEVMIVRDRDPAPPLAAAPQGLPVRSLESSATDPTAKRNIGWRAASAPLVAFTDDDCRPHPRWAEELLAAAGEHPGSILQGRTQPDPDEAHLLHGLARSIEVTGPSPWFETCNIAYPRALLEDLGGFDEAFDFYGEDTDLGLRAMASGASRAWVPEALVWHAVVPRPLHRAVRDAFRTHSAALVFARHPAQRRHIFLGIFSREAHARLLVAIVGLLASRRTRLAFLAALPYATYHLDTQRTTPRQLLRQALHLPARACLDVAETLATGRAAIRHRTFLL